jgi:hypothetical protein
MTMARIMQVAGQSNPIWLSSNAGAAIYIPDVGEDPLWFSRPAFDNSHFATVSTLSCCCSDVCRFFVPPQPKFVTRQDACFYPQAVRTLTFAQRTFSVRASEA